MKRFLLAYLALVALAWGWALPLPGPGATPLSAWAVREHALTLTGLWAFALMSLAMVLATRPARLEGAFGGAEGSPVLARGQAAMAALPGVRCWIVGGHSRGGATVHAGVLRFSGAPGQGAAWRWSPDGCSDGLALDAVRVALDLQSRVLLQLRGSAGAPVWVWVERDRAPADWLALRRALVSDRPV